MIKVKALGKTFAGNALGANMSAVACLLAATGVVAEGDHRMIEEIVVSATKRDTMLQDTPVAVSAFDQAMLAKAGLTEVSDLASAVPNLSMGTEGFSNALEVSMRGITSSSNTESSNAAVSINLDGVYIPRPQGGNALFYDVERVEVLRGPQGTLFGRNATGGAINVISHKPTDQLEGEVQFQVGNFDRLAARGVINLPVTDSFALRASLQFDEHDGYFDNGGSPVPISEDYGAADQAAARVGALFTPTDSFSWSLVYEAFEEQGTPTLGVPNPLPTGEDIFERAVNTVPELDIDFKTFRSRIDWDISDELRITYVAGFGTMDRLQKSDLDGGLGSPLNVSTFTDAENEFSSHDLQLQSTDEGALQWTLGVFYFEEENDMNFRFQVPEIDVAGMFLNRGRGQEAWAAYGQGTFSITDTVRVTAGARYTEDTKNDDDANVYACPGQGTVDISTVDVSSCGLIAHETREEDFDAITWRLGVDWDMTEDILLYGSAATGFKSGGFSNNQPTYDEETVLTIEAGLKGTFLEGTLRLNAALFTSAYEDLQVSQVVGGQQLTQNAAEATINGLEIEGVWLIGENTQVDGFISWLDAEFDDYENACDASQTNCGAAPILQNLSGNKLNRSPEWSLNLAIEHNFAVGSHGTLTPRLSVHWEDDSYLRVFNRNDTDLQDSWTKTDFTLTYEPNEGGWDVQLYAKNLEDDEIKQTALVDPLGNVTSSYSAPRTFGIKFDYRWE